MRQLHLVPLGSRRPLLGFTLIELLVVIAVISLLVSILLPSLNMAKELARRAVCASNLRTAGQAVYIYSEDYDARFPDLGASVSGEGGRWMGNLTYTMSHADDRPIRPLNPYLNITPGNAPHYPPGVGDNHFAPDIASPCRCPSDRKPLYEGGYGVSGSNYEIHGSSYGFNTMGRGVLAGDPRPGWGDGLKGLRTSDVRNVGEVLLSGDYAWGYGLAAVTWPPSEAKYRARSFGPHEPGTTWGNGLFVDGHVSWVYFDDIGDPDSFWYGDGWTLVAQ